MAVAAAVAVGQLAIIMVGAVEVEVDLLLLPI
jgi:hypothetical protein